MTEIAERSCVARSTLHRHFPSREALIEQLALAAAAAFEQCVAAVDPQSAGGRTAMRQATAGVLRESVKWRVSRYAPLGTLPRGAARESMRSRMIGLVEAGQRDGTVRNDLSALSLYFAWLGLVLTWVVFRGSIEDPDAAADEVMQILLPAPNPEPLVMKIIPFNRRANSPARIVLEADGELNMRLVLDHWNRDDMSA